MIKTLSVVIPVKDEGKRLAITLSDIHTSLEQRGINHEIIAVLSPGTDHSVDLAKRLTNSMKELKIIILKEDKGKGFAIKKGLRKAKNSWVLIMDSDNSVSIVEIEKMLPYTKTNDLIFGSRQIPPVQKTKGFMYTCGQLCRSIGKAWAITDSQCSFKLISKKLANAVIKNSVVNDSTIHTEIIAIAKQAKMSTQEVPVTWHETKDIGLDSKSYGTRLQSFSKIKKNIEKGQYNHI